jgi:hypothetical protein
MNVSFEAGRQEVRQRRAIDVAAPKRGRSPARFSRAARSARTHPRLGVDEML